MVLSASLINLNFLLSSSIKLKKKKMPIQWNKVSISKTQCIIFYWPLSLAKDHTIDKIQPWLIEAWTLVLFVLQCGEAARHDGLPQNSMESRKKREKSEKDSAWEIGWEGIYKCLKWYGWGPAPETARKLQIVICWCTKMNSDQSLPSSAWR